MTVSLSSFHSFNTTQSAVPAKVAPKSHQVSQAYTAPQIQFGAGNDDLWSFLQKAADKAGVVGKQVLETAQQFGTDVLKDPKKALQDYGENKLVYQPTAGGLIPAKVSLEQVQDAELRVKIQEVTFNTSDNVKIHGWYVAPKPGQHTILYSHGNGGTIGIRGPIIKLFTDAGYGMLAYDYRGFGNSEGSPSEAGLYKDQEAATNFLRDVKNTPFKQQILLGESIGGAIAIDAASKNNYRMLVTLSTFTSLPEVAGSLFKNVPGISDLTKKFLPQIIQQQYPSFSKLDTVVSPTLIVHGTADELVPYEMSNRLYEKLEKRPNGDAITDHLEVGGADHNNVLGVASTDILTAMKNLENKTLLMYPGDPQF
jgi:alpha-beta hydrolase superfamily lysophospholipase